MARPAFIITIGASAGGLNAISELVAQLPEELDAAVFIVLHLSKIGLGDFLISRLQKYTPFTCVIPKDQDEIERGHIYIAPPDTHLLIKDRKIILGHGPAENRWRPSVDVLFRSAAANYSNHVIGIILTGYLNDGTAGMQAIKQSKGYCIVQDPNQAEYRDMPSSVLDTMEVDFCIPLDQMGETIMSIVQNAPTGQNSPPRQVLNESRIAENAVTSIASVAELGEKSLYSCPDCGGGLWVVSDSNIKRYRCHIGHSYTENDLLVKQSESVESTLWIALRIMEERRMLLMKIGDDENRKGLGRLAVSHLQRAEELQEHIQKLKEVLFAGQKPNE